MDKISQNINPLNYKKVYFSKTSNHGNVRFLKNENIVFCNNIGYDLADKIYLNNGYKVLYPELLSIKDMIAALKNCEEFVAQSGSNAHNAIFLSDNAKITILNRSAHFHPCQTMINKLRNLKVTYVDCFCEELPIDWGYGPYIFLYTNELKQYLDDSAFKYNAKKLEKESLIQFKRIFYFLGKTYTKLVTKDVIGYELNEDSFIKFISFINKYLNKIYKKPSNKISNMGLIENKSYLFGLMQKQVNIHKPSKTRWKIFGKEFLRYKTSNKALKKFNGI